MNFIKKNIQFLKQNSGVLFLLIAILALLSIEAHKEQYKFVITMFLIALISSAIAFVLFRLEKKKLDKEQNHE